MIIQKLFDQNNPTQNEKLTLLKEHFPNCFDKDGHFLPEKMASELQSSDIVSSREFYQLNWLGKSYARYLRDCPPITLFGENQSHNQAPQNINSQNLLIKGDNLEVLKHLKNAYQRAVKMIYIDPPYNTGSDGFVYQDDRKFTPEQLAQLADMSLDEAKRVLDFTAKKSNSHSAWLTFMYPRLYIARELLKDDGVIFISIDDNEQAQLKLLCDEIFGEENFIAELIVNVAPAGSQSSNDFAQQHQYCFVYRKTNRAIISRFPLSDEELDEKYTKQDELGYFYIERLWKRGIGGKMEDVPTLHFPVYFDTKTEEIYIDEEISQISNHQDIIKIIPYQTKGVLGRWTWSKLKMMNERHKLKVAIVAGEYKLHKKLYRNEDDGKKPFSIIDSKLGRTELGSLEVKDIFDGGKYFDYPKSSILIKYFLQMMQDKNDIILDFFAGSGTTAHAVMQLNAEDKGNRQFILVQLDEKSKKEAHKAGFDTIFEITKERIIRSAQKIQSENPDYTGDLGFKIFETVDNFLAIDDNEINPQTALPDLFSHTFSDDEYHTLLTTWRVYDGHVLTDKAQSINLADYTAYLCDKTLYIIYLDFDSVHIKALLDKLDNDKSFLIERIVLFGLSVDSAKQKELAQALTTYNNKKNLNIHLVVRVL
ncbi:MAG: site-specific DNA-methyltransferase [Moraxella sp.]|nr:site-specific DNA-methyltransferase [Moraxella sp.]